MSHDYESSFIGVGCLGSMSATGKLMQITAVSSLCPHRVTNDVNNEHFIFSCTASSSVTEMKDARRDELLHGVLS